MDNQHTARVVLLRRPEPKQRQLLPWLVDMQSEDEVRRFSYNHVQQELRAGLNGSLDRNPGLRKETVERCTGIIAHAIDAVIGMKSAADVKKYLAANSLYGVMKQQNDSPQHMLYVELKNDARLKDAQQDKIESALKSGLDFAQARLTSYADSRIMKSKLAEKAGR